MVMIRQFFLFVFIFGSCALASNGQEVGEYGFLKLPVSTHAAALGGSCVSVVEPDLALSDQNPALLCPEMSGQVALSYMNYVSDINLGYAAYAGRMLTDGTWTVGMRYVNYGDFEGYDEHGVATGSFSAKDIVANVGLGYPINDRWRCGAVTRFIYSKYDCYSAFAIGVDVGLNYYNEVAGRSFSVVLSNLGGQLKKMEERTQHLPTQLTVGISKEVEHLPFCLTLTAYDLLDWDKEYIDGSGNMHEYNNGEQLLNHLIFGLEWMAADNFYLAAAYNYRRQREFSGTGGFLRGMSFGGGFKYRSWSLQCAYARYNAVDGSLNLGLSYQF